MADINTSSEIYKLIYACLGGILPALFWLWFWLKEDKLHPEPRSKIMLVFLAGMIAVPFAYPLEKWVADQFGMTVTTYALWAFIEESFKFAVAWVIALRITRVYNEPIDAPEYLITAALGFSALENVFFILDPLLQGYHLEAITTGDMRFMGASLLHVVSSAILGYCIGREFRESKIKRTLWAILGLGLAVALHTVFNMFIMYDNGSQTFLVFGCVWTAVIGVLLLLEKLKKR